MYERERSLVQKYENRPFVLIGVNSDEPSQLKGIISSSNLTWDSWADGPRGPIASQWDVHSYPTIVLIDHKGVIRDKNLRDESLELAIDQLVLEAEKSLASEAKTQAPVSPPAPANKPKESGAALKETKHKKAKSTQKKT